MAVEECDLLGLADPNGKIHRGGTPRREISIPAAQVSEALLALNDGSNMAGVQRNALIMGLHRSYDCPRKKIATNLVARYSCHGIGPSANDFDLLTIEFKWAFFRMARRCGQHSGSFKAESWRAAQPIVRQQIQVDGDVSMRGLRMAGGRHPWSV